MVKSEHGTWARYFRSRWKLGTFFLFLQPLLCVFAKWRTACGRQRRWSSGYFGHPYLCYHSSPIWTHGLHYRISSAHVREFG
ncbi:hypothetical protein BJX64DRAFT_269803 [Aspergillus heterothallicus]